MASCLKPALYSKFFPIHPPAQQHTCDACTRKHRNRPLEHAGIRQIFIRLFCRNGRFFVGLHRRDSVFRLHSHGVVPAAGFWIFFGNREQRRRTCIHRISNLRFFSDNQIQTGFSAGKRGFALLISRLAGIRREFLRLYPSGEFFGAGAAILCRGQVIDCCAAGFIGRQQRKTAVRRDFRDAVQGKCRAENRLFSVPIFNREASGFCRVDGFVCESETCQQQRGQQAEQQFLR